jgi:hypothetical protein
MLACVHVHRERDVCLTVYLLVQQNVMFASSQQRIPVFETHNCLPVIHSVQNNMLASSEQKVTTFDTFSDCLPCEIMFYCTFSISAAC